MPSFNANDLVKVKHNGGHLFGRVIANVADGAVVQFWPIAADYNAASPNENALRSPAVHAAPNAAVSLRDDD